MNHIKHLNDFYSSDSPEEWKKIIGNELHYHYGYFSNPNTSLEEALRQAVRNFYAFIPRGSRVLDAGCGWGGPANMLSKEMGCDVLGLTISQAQFEYCNNMGVKVKLADLETVILDQEFDIIIMIESLEHILKKRQLLEKLRTIGKRIIIRTTCTSRESRTNKPEYADTMYLQTPANLRQYLEQSGWRLLSVKNQRAASKLTLTHWKYRLQQAYGDNPPTGHLRDLLNLSNHALANWELWAADHPLLDIVTE
jgi:cyclopropane fatty-acyl-phospholipid synthase-like methyltransferase